MHQDAGVPILVGTTSVEKSAAIARILSKRDIKHEVLNAKHHENEAYVVAQAGRKGAITVSTNMAGRGTDIVLGGNPDMIAKLEFKEADRDPEVEQEAFDKRVEELTLDCENQKRDVLAGSELADGTRHPGGLYIVGTERHESRRIDNQLRGRAGRQGDPGKSRFYLSLEDDLMRIFAGDRVKGYMERLGMPDNEPIEHPWVTKSVENAQKKVEERNFDIRKNLLEYDDVMSAQRATVYQLRQQLLQGRYDAVEFDHDGKPTGDKREVVASQELIDTLVPEVGSMLGMFCEDPILPHDESGEARQIGRDEFEDATLVEAETLRQELYTRWGIVLDVEKKSALDVYDELAKLVPVALAEQRDRLLDLVDRVVGAIVEDSCPLNKPPDDWDWNGVFEGFEDHYGAELEEDIADYGDRDALAREMYEVAEVAYKKREEEIGLELVLRVFRHIYLEELDSAWVDHLTNMDHLRDGIGLRGYGQKDPKQEYKKEGYNMFVTMLAQVSSSVVRKLMSAQIEHTDDEAALEQADLERHMAELAAAVARHGGDSDPASSSPGMLAPPHEEPPVVADMECPCGSGKLFAECHGNFDDNSEDGDI
jgi:preprotein translocase subunit SecA